MRDIYLANIATFETYLRAEKQLSSLSIESYLSDLVPLKDIRSLEQFLDDLSTRGYQKTTLHRKLTSLNTFLTYLYLEKKIETHPKQLLKLPRAKQRLPKALSQDEITQFFTAKRPTKTPVRDQLIFHLLYGCGLRISELCALPYQHMNLTQHILKVTGKGGHQRIVPIHETIATLFTEYMKTRPESQHDTLFLNNRQAPLHRQSVYTLVKAQLAAANLNMRYSPHSFRHSFATHILENGGDLRRIQALLGHRTISTTQIYTQLDRRSLKDAYHNAHPSA